VQCRTGDGRPARESRTKTKEEAAIIRGKRGFSEPPERAQHRINNRIRVSPVRLIGADGTQIGIVPVEEALAQARAAGLDLVEVASEARPIVCRIMDYGRFLYEQEKKAREARRNQTVIQVKDVKLRPAIDDADFLTKVRMAERFLKKGFKVRVTVMFRRREMRRPENGYEVLARVIEHLKGLAVVEQEPPDVLDGRDLTMVLRPA